MKSNASKFRLAGVVLYLFVCVFLSSTTKAQELNFDFTIIGDPSIDDPSTTYFAGTVTGEIIGLENNGTSNPSDIIITSAPAGLDITSLPYSLKDNGWNVSSRAGGAFTVSDGTITSDLNYIAFLAGQDDEFALNESIVDTTPNVGVFNGFDFNGKAVANLDGFSGATFTLEVPEPSTWAMLTGSLGMLAFWRLHGRRICPAS